MKSRAVEYLSKSPLLHMGMLEAINRNTALILYAAQDGVLIRETKSGANMISVHEIEKGKEILELISAGSLFAVHQGDLADYIADKYMLRERLECVQAAYTEKTRLDVANELKIRRLELIHKEVVLEHYNKLSECEITELLKEGCIFGGYKEDVLIGFGGIHLEGSIGLLEVFPEHRRRGYGAILESYIMNYILDKGFVPFCQIEVDNNNSIALQRKLGFQISEDSLYWLF